MPEPTDETLIECAEELVKFLERRNLPGCFYGDQTVAASLRAQVEELRKTKGERDA